MDLNTPFPIATIRGSVTTEPTQENMLRTKLLSAMPWLLFRGINSVNIVVTRAKMSMLPTPKKKLATMGAATLTWKRASQPYAIKAQGNIMAPIQASEKK